jgi:hypothetical protein
LRMAFRRREKALQYMSLFKSSLQSLAYVFGTSKIDADKKREFKTIATNISDELIDYLASKKQDASAVQNASHTIYMFTQSNRKGLGRRLAARVLLFTFRVNESVEFLLATKRHRIPWGPKAIVLFAIYVFIIFYPAGLLNRTGFDVSFLYVFAMTAIKAFLLISFYNIQDMLEDPFNQNSPDGIRVNDFRFLQLPEPVIVSKKQKQLPEEQDFVVDAQPLEEKTFNQENQPSKQITTSEQKQVTGQQ